ncbi:protein kinase domain-containing protein [Flavisolibacter nicotianae]|uniref:protein kinase domain-containing protein n=1 Tax=Flavisolibacter nicotianae TaxID=2364882 RepID=UPI000EB00A8C|nr:protein kinase [Flavisolibacter nicotianae]
MAKVFTITEGLENMGALKTGGQGSVYKAKRIGEIITAVKLLPTPIYSESEQDKAYVSFQNEVRKLKKVNEEPNPNVVKILNHGFTDSGSFPFIEMEFIEGPDLEDLLKPPHDPVFTIQLSNALAHCHRLDVKHGDIKSNNVKFNKHTGNYMLLDFGLAAMSDEQRRTSLRHAGAIEFMAPEQSEGQLLFQTDVYGFGVILFELLAGQVPFPLKDNSESARNMVMLAHLDQTPPDLKDLRRQHLPDSWSPEKKEKEMQVPEWLLSLIYRCLRKKPQERFANGIELHNHILTSSVGTYRAEVLTEHNPWQYQAEKLLKEKQQLQQQLAAKDAELVRLRSQPLPQPVTAGAERYPGQDDYGGNTRRNSAWILAFLFTLLVASGLAYALIRSNTKPKEPEEKKEVASNPVTQPKQNVAIGEYRVSADKTYFHNEPDASTKRNAFLSKGDPITAYEDQNGFVYTEFTNSRGQTSKGWLRKDNLLTADEWNARQQQQQNREPTQDEIKTQLTLAAGYVRTNQMEEALTIYNFLSTFNVPEALYQAGNYGLQGKNPSVNCTQALSLLMKASDAGYLPAKRTLGVLYLFAENPAWLQINNYNQCSYTKDVDKARQLLSQAANGGDTTARKLLDELNLNTQPR